MDWEALILETARRAGLDGAQARQTLDAFFDTVVEQMETEDLIQLRPDFGYFELREAGGEKNVHGDALRKCRRTPVFKKANTLKKRLRQDDESYLEMLRATGRDAQADRLSKKQDG